jgi:hypothetical protein
MTEALRKVACSVRCWPTSIWHSDPTANSRKSATCATQGKSTCWALAARERSTRASGQQATSAGFDFGSRKQLNFNLSQRDEAVDGATRDSLAMAAA